MCGIFGLLGKRDRDAIKAANRTLSHRGPDAEGYWFQESPAVALCHRRLSILDLSASGAQPMVSDSGRYIVSYNGELYNFKELKERLPQKQWRGHSDTEVLLACFEEWGLEKTLQQIEGMYAIALWDTQQKKLALVRDRLGEKPLYYGRVGSDFVFSSELKPVIHLSKSQLSLDPVAIEDYFHRSCISGERSIFKEIRKLPAGHFVVISAEAQEASTTSTASTVPKMIPTPQKYWSLQDLSLGSLRLSAQEAPSHLETKLRKAIQQQMIADVPLGAFLSGGVDSSLIVALMQSLSSQKIKTFSIGFASEHYNEAPHAKAVARHLGTEHEELYVSEEDLLREVPNLSGIYDEPFADSSQIPTILVSKMAKRHVTVALSGDGGDELFAGYNRHLFAQNQWPRWQTVPGLLRQGVGNGLTLLPPSVWAALFQVISTGAAQPHEKIYKLASVLKSSSLTDFYKSVSTHWNEASPLLQKSSQKALPLEEIKNTLEMCLSDAKWYLPDDVLVKVDRAAMSQSLETRAPFLNKDVVETAFSLPIDLKIHQGQSKWILRQILYKYVPAELIERPKMGFGVPLDAWLRKELKDWAWSLLNPGALREQDVLDSKAVLAKWDEHQRGRRNWFTELWDVLMFLAWRQQFKI